LCVLVTKIELQKLSNMNIANARLHAALERLEKALVDKSKALSDTNSDIKLSEALETEINVLRRENTRLKLLNETVSKRLDGVIGQLKDFIEDV